MKEYIEKITATISPILGFAPEVEVHYDVPVIVIPKNKVHGLLKFLKTDSKLGLNFLTTMCGIHFPDKLETEFCLMYQLHNMQTNERLRIRTFMPKSDLTMPTITDIWLSSNWMEREAFDFYGFQFTGHPNLIRVLNMEEMNYHPMRKEYALEDASRTDKEDKYFGR
jgi:NADH-quinone oxidoreductase subunit C